MRFSEFTYNGNRITNSFKINEILRESFSWLLTCEFENVKIEIKNSTLIWLDGVWYNGDFNFGIWENGEFRGGNFINGIIIDGNFKGGVIESAIIKGGYVSENVKKLNKKYEKEV
jgi:hypothetical protein